MSKSAVAQSTGRRRQSTPSVDENRIGSVRIIGLIAGRELAAAFDSSIAYVYTIAFLILANSLFMNEFFLVGTADMSRFFEQMPLLMAFFMPAITMRSWAEERKSRTIETLLTLPIAPAQAVIGKFLAALTLLCVFIAGTLPIPIMLSILGSPDVGQIAAGYIGLLLLGAMFLAIGMAISAVTSDQIVAFVGATLFGFALVLIGHDRVVPVIDGLWPSAAAGTFLYEHISVTRPFQSFVRGVIDASSVLYFGLLAAVFLWLNVQALNRFRT